MAKFTCNNPECIEDHELNGEDIRLKLTVEDGVKTEYFINEDGTLELYDSDGTGQTMTVECPICGQEYEIEDGYGYFEIKEVHMLPFDQDELADLKVKKV